MTLVVITSPERLPGEGDLVVRLFESGLLRLHLRKPGWNIGEMRNWLQQVPREYHGRIRLHQAWELALDFGVGGLHAGEKLQGKAGLDQATILLEQLPQLQLSLALHDPAQIPLLGPPYQDALLSPVFESLSKQGYQPSWNLLEWAGMILESPLPLLALGGVTAANLTQVKAFGFAGAAVLGAVWQAADPATAFLELQQRHQELWNP